MKPFINISASLAIFLLSLIPSFVKGQLLPEDRDYKIGIRGGLNFSNLSVHNVIDERTRTGLNIGIFFKKEIIEHFSIQPELLYSGKGSELAFANQNFTGIAKINLRYLDIPVLLVYNPTPFFNVHLGPYFGFLMGTNVKNVHEPIPEKPFHDFETEINRRNFSFLDAGIVAGMGVELGIFNAGMRYNFGMTEIGRTTTVFGVPYGFPGAKNHLAQLYVGLGF